MSLRGIRSVRESKPAIEGVGDGSGRMHGFQLWAKLPSALKMGAPRYQDIRAEEIPEVHDDDGSRARMLCTDRTLRAAPAQDRYIVSFDSGDKIRVRAGPEGMRFLLASGRPLGEPIA
jgi:redox-sensitive bicupin YhaK (pirin superfamily)